jgi:hypothetical protein
MRSVVSRKCERLMEKFAKPVTEHGVWRNRTTKELTEKLETRDLVANTIVKRLEGQGTVIRMEQFICFETKNYLHLSVVTAGHLPLTIRQHRMMCTCGC